MNILFLMLPLDTVVPEKDTSFALMLAAQARGHRVFHLLHKDIAASAGKLTFSATEVVPRDGRPAADCFEVLSREQLTQDEADVLFIRTDPPFDADYLTDTRLLDLAEPSQLTVVNSPRGLQSVCEKLWAVRFPELTPRTLVTASQEQFHQFLEEHERVVVKPADLFGGQGIFLLAKEDVNAPVAFETLSEGGTKQVVVQEFLAEAKEGDKRILLLDGEPLGAILRKQQGEADHRNNLFAGGVALPVELDANDENIVATLRPFLKSLGLRFVGIDVIGGKLIEVNVTSPTCLRELEKFSGKDLAGQVVERVTQKAAGTTRDSSRREA